MKYFKLMDRDEIVEIYEETELKGIYEDEDGEYDLCDDPDDDRAFDTAVVAWQKGTCYIGFDEPSTWGYLASVLELGNWVTEEEYKKWLKDTGKSEDE